MLPIPLPLDDQLEANRGSAKTVCPGERKTICEIKTSRCMSGIAIGVVLDVRVLPDNETREPLDCDPDQDDENLPLIRAHLQWGIGGTSFSAQCDFLLGTIIVIPAETIKIDAEYLVLSCEECPPLNRYPAVKAGVGFAYYGVGRNSNSARFTDLVCVDPGQKKIVQIPQYALSWTALLTEPGTAATVRAFGFGAGLKIRYNIVAPLTNVGQHDVENSFPVFGGERFLEIENTSQVLLKTILIYGLSF